MKLLIETIDEDSFDIIAIQEPSHKNSYDFTGEQSTSYSKIGQSPINSIIQTPTNHKITPLLKDTVACNEIVNESDQGIIIIIFKIFQDYYKLLIDYSFSVFKKFVKRSLINLKYDIENMHKSIDALESTTQKILDKLGDYQGGNIAVNNNDFENDIEFSTIQSDDDLNVVEGRLTSDRLYRKAVV